jgi:hypothetical protein
LSAETTGCSYDSKKCKKYNLKNSSRQRDTLSYWLGRPSGERLAAVDLLRRQQHGNPGRLQRTARIIQQIYFIFFLTKRGMLNAFISIK